MRRKRQQYDINNDLARMGYAFPVVVLFLILAPFFFVVLYVIIPQYGWGITGVMNMIVSTSFILLILINYFKSLLTPPGSPAAWIPDEEAGELETITESPHRFCEKCRGFKPARCHHCKICNKCILKMDHHCPWINNCVGQDNHKFFLLFLVYAVSGISYALVLLFICFINALSTPKGIEDFVIIFGFTITATLMLPVGLAILMLLCWQLWLVKNNTTSIEYEDYERQKRIHRKEGKILKYENKYDVGLMGNLREVFGSGRPVWWFLPYAPIPDPSHFKRDYRPVSKVLSM